MSKKRIKAQLMEAAPKGGTSFKYEWVLPATSEAYEQMVEQMAKAARAYDINKIGHDVMTRAALRAIGITPPKKGQT